jgi:hypothetical protein
MVSDRVQAHDRAVATADTEADARELQRLANRASVKRYGSHGPLYYVLPPEIKAVGE